MLMSESSAPLIPMRSSIDTAYAKSRCCHVRPNGNRRPPNTTSFVCKTQPWQLLNSSKPLLVKLPLSMCRSQTGLDPKTIGTSWNTSALSDLKDLGDCGRCTVSMETITYLGHLGLYMQGILPFQTLMRIKNEKMQAISYCVLRKSLCMRNCCFARFQADRPKTAPPLPMTTSLSRQNGH